VVWRACRLSATSPRSPRLVTAEHPPSSLLLSPFPLPLPSPPLSVSPECRRHGRVKRSFQPAIVAPTVGQRPFLRGREARASRTSSSGCSALCSPHGRTDRAAVAATLADGAAEARGPLSSTTAGQRRGRARPPPGPGKPPHRCRLSRPSPAGPSRDLLQSVMKRTPGTSRRNLKKSKGLSEKSVT